MRGSLLASKNHLHEMQTINYVLLLFFAFLIPLITLLSVWRSKRKSVKQAPEPPGSLPVIGHLYLLNHGQKNFLEILESTADSHGPVFKLRFGMRHMLVVCNLEAAKDCLVVHDKALAGRPQGAAGKILGFDCKLIAFRPYDDYWRSARKLMTEHLLSRPRVEMLRQAREAEIDALLRDLHQSWVNNQREPVLVAVDHLLRAMSNNFICNVVIGERFYGSSGDGSSDEARRFRQAMGRFIDALIGSSVPAVPEAFPFLRRVMDWGGREAAMASVAQEMDAVMEGILENHRQRRRRRLAGEPEHSNPDFMDAMLDVVEGGEFCDMDSDAAIKATTLDLLLAGSGHAGTMLTRIIALLARHRHVLKRAQDEMDVHVGKDRRVNEFDLEKLTYLHAVAKEAFRLYPSAVLLLTREATSDCQIGGFHCAAGTRVLVHVGRMQRDPSAWGPDAGEFKPERFLEPSPHADTDMRGLHLEFIPFGSGRRGCPGVHFALQLVHMTLARLVQGLEMEALLPAPGGGEEIKGDDDDPMFTTPGAELKLMIAPRLRDELYV